MGLRINKINFYSIPSNTRQDHKSGSSTSLALFLRISSPQHSSLSARNYSQSMEKDEKSWSVFSRVVTPSKKRVSFKDFEEKLHQKNLISSTLPRCALNPEEKEELFEIAHLVEKCNVQEAVRRFNRLPESQKTIIQRHLVQLGSHHPPSLVTNLFKTKQALFATAFEESHYFSKREVTRWFQELRACLQEDQEAGAETKRIALFP